jgi:hypothetical protein
VQGAKPLTLTLAATPPELERMIGIRFMPQITEKVEEDEEVEMTHMGALIKDPTRLMAAEAATAAAAAATRLMVAAAGVAAAGAAALTLPLTLTLPLPAITWARADGPSSLDTTCTSQLSPLPPSPPPPSPPLPTPLLRAPSPASLPLFSLFSSLPLFNLPSKPRASTSIRTRRDAQDQHAAQTVRRMAPASPRQPPHRDARTQEVPCPRWHRRNISLPRMDPFCQR